MGYFEFLLIFFLAFIVIGPKDFPKIMFKIGDFWRRLKMTCSSFYEQLEDISENEIITKNKTSPSSKKNDKISRKK